MKTRWKRTGASTRRRSFAEESERDTGSATCSTVLATASRRLSGSLCLARSFPPLHADYPPRRDSSSILIRDGTLEVRASRGASQRSGYRGRRRLGIVTNLTMKRRLTCSSRRPTCSSPLSGCALLRSYWLAVSEESAVERGFFLKSCGASERFSISCRMALSNHLRGL